MAKHTLGTLIADGSTSGVKLYNDRRQGDSKFTIFAFGTFGGGTLTIQLSPDNGATWISAGSDGVSTSDKVSNLRTASDPNAPVLVRANLVGATSPNIVITLFNVK